MGTSLAFMILFGLLMAALFNRLHIPGLLGMIVVGIILGPYGLNFLSKDILSISADLRQIALLVILLRAGLGIKKEAIKKVGRPAIYLSFIPGLFEGFTIALISIYLFHFTFIQGGILGFIIAAVSPAVVVPSMLDLIQQGIGEAKSIPTLILAGASIDDVVAITIFSVFLGMYGGHQLHLATQLLSIPLSIFLGIVLGVLFGWSLLLLFKRFSIRHTKKVLVLIACAILLTRIETLFKDQVAIASLLGVMAMGFLINEKNPNLGKQLSQHLNKIWVFAELLLFILVGAQVNVALALNAGIKGIILITIGLIARSIGVYLSLLGTDLNTKEKWFCMIAYTPKATVQAAIGSIPLAMGVASGDLILSLAVLAIVITAPLGAFFIKRTGPLFLK
ncbi:cation:proton antiporter [Atopobacter phocae]|uniref:cation:proton antiporter n=1 Tax=Atopobacter phocae TaxID=136492 RepID=UPI00046F1D9D|nr:cation:proton antiporter [Atopobacter phocae]